MPKEKHYKRKKLRKEQRREVFDKTGGRCYLCSIKLDNNWCAGYIVPHTIGGDSSLNNLLPICWTCSRLRWFFFEPEEIQRIMRLGRYADAEIKKDSELGRAIDKLYKRRLAINKGRRE